MGLLVNLVRSEYRVLTEHGLAFGTLQNLPFPQTLQFRKQTVSVSRYSILLLLKSF